MKKVVAKDVFVTVLNEIYLFIGVNKIFDGDQDIKVASHTRK